MFPINEIYHLEDELIVVAIDAYMHKCHFQKVGNEYIQTGPSNSTAAGPGAMRVKGQNVCLARRVAGVRFGLFECRLSGCSRCR